ncbi:MAG TPA: DUF3306 domain-containing protein [Albitalea sp.]|uniref:DUF3306 domain-containing protein n=1 Tax=Piscinibacter sp. TaxID=1903157 RepID=UPI002ED0254E
MSDENFLSRWSRRKAQANAGVEIPPEPAAPAAAVPAPVEVPPAPPPEEPPLTMDDVARLTPESDFSRFVAPKVDESVKRAALKKLFADPRFNVMDGLDTYIDDYSQPDPLPESMLRQMAQAKFLGLFQEEASPDGEGAQPVPQSSTDSPAAPPDEDADLRLQQDDAPGRGGPGKGPAA